MLRRIAVMMCVSLFLSVSACTSDPEIDDEDTTENNYTAPDCGGGCSQDVCGTPEMDTSTSGCGMVDIGPDGGEAELDRCPGYREPSESLCRSQQDCEGVHGGSSCYPPGLDPPGGICFPMTQDCDPADGTTCGENELCESYIAEASCDGEMSTRCVMDCRVDASVCASDQSCGDEGICIFLRCDADEVTCPSDASCLPEDGAADKFGCVRGVCESDGDCSCGACVLGRCYEGPGRCELPRP